MRSYKVGWLLDQVNIANGVGAKIIGVNNRNLNNFEVDINNASRLSEYIDDSAIYVAESGIQTVDDGLRLLEAGADALLIGEAFMRSDDKGAFIRKLRGEYDQG